MAKHDDELVAILYSAIDKIREKTSSNYPDAEVRRLARLFADMDDDQQAKFFVEAAAIMSDWKAGMSATQAYYIGRHLRTCTCSSSEARQFIADIHCAINEGGQS